MNMRIYVVLKRNILYLCENESCIAVCYSIIDFTLVILMFV
jgi:hypothetical protein